MSPDDVIRLRHMAEAASERKKRAAEALACNALVQSWPEITRLARETAQATAPETRDMFGA